MRIAKNDIPPTMNLAKCRKVLDTCLRVALMLGIMYLPSGCATKTYFPTERLREDDAKMIFIRTNALPFTENFIITVDGKKAASLAYRSVVEFYVSPGEHSIVVGIGWFRGGKAKFDSEFKPGSENFFFLSSKYVCTGIGPSFPYVIPFPEFEHIVGIRDLTKAEAQLLIYEQ